MKTVAVCCAVVAVVWSAAAVLGTSDDGAPDTKIQTDGFTYMSPTDKVLHVLYYIIGLSVFDFAVASRTPARWLWLHAAGNAVVTWAATPDLLATLLDPVNSMDGKLTAMGRVPSFVIPAMHIVHVVSFPPLPRGEIVHHVVFGAVICVTGLYLDAGTIQNAVGWAICGFPGGVNYVMLALVKAQVMPKMAQKVWNARTNVWLRAPLLLFCAFACWVADNPHGLSRVGTLAIGALCFANGLYYMQVVVVDVAARSRDGAAHTPFTS